MGANDNKETPRSDKRILGEPFTRCARCDRPIRKSEATLQKGKLVCPEDVDTLDHEGETG